MAGPAHSVMGYCILLCDSPPEQTQGPAAKVSFLQNGATKQTFPGRFMELSCLCQGSISKNRTRGLLSTL